MKIGIIDIETTGWLKKGGKIIEIGIVSLDPDTGEREIVFSSVCHETGITEKEVSDCWVLKNSTLTVDDVKFSPNLTHLIPYIQHLINSFELGVTAFNIGFDFPFLEDRGLRIDNKLNCLMLTSTDICKLPNPIRAGTFKWPTAIEAYQHFTGITASHPHRAAKDAMLEAEICWELIKNHGLEIIV